jgi:uncharacterized protein (TIGR00730 family)
MNICVYCGSNLGENKAYRQAAQSLGQAMARRNHGLVYGGASIGLMGTVADELIDTDLSTIGVIPETLMKREVAHDNLDELIVTETMHQRKATMAERSDAFLALPGGFGTMEEIFETVTWAQLRIHNKPLVLLNINGYYDKLYAFIRHCSQEGFIHDDSLPLLHLESDIDLALDWLETQAKQAKAQIDHYDRS